jgi:hypothetical protein
LALAIGAVALVASGCGSPGSQLVGDWSSQIQSNERLANEISPLDSPSGDPDDGEGSDYSIRLKFYRSGQLDTVTQLANIQTRKSGRWQLVNFDEATQTATIECELMQQRTQHQVEFVDKHTIRLVPPNMAGLNLKLVFIRE